MVTMKPNITRRTLHSELLGMNFRLWVSMRAWRTIMKRGSFDNYILNTSPKYLDSRFGVYLRNLMVQRQKNPSFKVPVIPGHYSQSK